MKLYLSSVLLVLATVVLTPVSAATILDYINPFFWIYQLFYNTLVSQGVTCNEFEVGIETSVGKGDIVDCFCNTEVTTFLWFPTAATTRAFCEVNKKNLTVTGERSASFNILSYVFGFQWSEI